VSVWCMGKFLMLSIGDLRLKVKSFSKNSCKCNVKK
jgi:hypothetical protein